MIEARFEGSSMATAYGLTQWDYGQILRFARNVEVPDGTEVEFYQGESASVASTASRMVRIPDVMLQNPEEILGYVCIRTETSGETILTVRMPIKPRPQPKDYVLPETEEYRRLLPNGGDAGQILRKRSIENYSVGWGEAADNVKVIDGAIQLMSGNREIGDRVRIGGGTDGREIELKNDGTGIAWRYTDSNEWNTLVSIGDITGPPGVTPEFELRDGHLIVKYNEWKGECKWQ